MATPTFPLQTVDDALTRGIDALRQMQRLTGEFPTYTSPEPDLAGATAYSKSVYATTFIIHSLASVADRPAVGPLLTIAGQFVEGQREDSGAWNYEGRGKARVPPDLDDTSCAVAALLKLGHRPDISFYKLLWENEAAPSGPYYTWIGINERSDAPHAREVDALVNVNILFACGLLGLPLAGATDYLLDVVRREAYTTSSLYCPSPHFIFYAITRAYADGNVIALGPAVPALLEVARTRLLGPHAEPSALHVACVAAGLQNLGAESAAVEPYLTRLLATQRADGSWPGWATWAGFAPNFDGSPALTSAIAIEALGKYLRFSGG